MTEMSGVSKNSYLLLNTNLKIRLTLVKWPRTERSYSETYYLEQYSR